MLTPIIFSPIVLIHFLGGKNKEKKGGVKIQNLSSSKAKIKLLTKSE